MSKCEEPICALLMSVAVSPKLLAFSAALNKSICPFIANYSSIQYLPIQDQGWSWLLRLELERLGSKYPLIHSFIGIRSISGPWKGELFCLPFSVLDWQTECVHFHFRWYFERKSVVGSDLITKLSPLSMKISNCYDKISSQKIFNC